MNQNLTTIMLNAAVVHALQTADMHTNASASKKKAVIPIYQSSKNLIILKKDAKNQNKSK